MGVEWVPKVEEKKDSKGKTVQANLVLVKEEGDDAKSLAKFLGVSQEKADNLFKQIDKDGKVKVPSDMPGMKQINEYLQDAYVDNPENYGKTNATPDNYNCFECAMTISSKAPTNFTYHLGSDKFKKFILDSYEDVGGSPDKYKFAQTVIRFREREFDLWRFKKLSRTTPRSRQYVPENSGCWRKCLFAAEFSTIMSLRIGKKQLVPQ
jgi:hypothetical protein